MRKIKIERYSRSYLCETCGTSYADGARIFLDGELAVDLEPFAHCYDGTSYSDDDIYRRAFQLVGVDLEEEFS